MTMAERYCTGCDGESDSHTRAGTVMHKPSFQPVHQLRWPGNEVIPNPDMYMQIY